MMKKIVSIICAISILLVLTGCPAFYESEINDMKGSITGNTYKCMFYSNSGEKFMTVFGTNIDMDSNIVKEQSYSDGHWGYTQTLSSVITITIDGHQIENCGSTVLFCEEGLEPDVDFMQENIEITSKANSLGDNVVVADIVNRYKNYFGKPVVAVIQSQLGDPICAFSGEKVYWKVCEDLPKTTKLMIDGHALYIHRANFQIIDIALLEN